MSGPSLRSPRRAPVIAGAAVALALAAGGALAARAAWERRPALGAEVDGLSLRVDRAVWLDHEAGVAPGAAHTQHLPGMPGAGFHRLAVSFAVENRATAERRFKWQSLALSWPRRAVEAVSHDGRAFVVLPPGHTALLEAWFDVPDTEDLLTLSWNDGVAPARLLTTRTPVHALPRRNAAVAWPELASELPPGDARRGVQLFRDKCASCHGDPAIPGSNVAGPHLRGIGAVAGTRIPTMPAAQYLYESILDPEAFHVHPCEVGERCPEPPPMPSYGETLSPKEMADLVAYLLAERSTP